MIKLEPMNTLDEIAKQSPLTLSDIPLIYQQFGLELKFSQSKPEFQGNAVPALKNTQKYHISDETLQKGFPFFLSKKGGENGKRNESLKDLSLFRKEKTNLLGYLYNMSLNT